MPMHQLVLMRSFPGETEEQFENTLALVADVALTS